METLPSEASDFVTFLRSIREVHVLCTEDSLDPNFPQILEKFERNFNCLYDVYKLNMTLKIHIIIHHYFDYFELSGINMKSTNGEFVESTHSALRIHEEKHGYKVVKKLGEESHIKKSIRSLTSFNSKRAGFSPIQSLKLKKKSSMLSSIKSD